LEKHEAIQHPTVLCVDDEPIGLMVRAKLLEMAGFSVITGADGPTALDLFRANKVDVVLLDYMMPLMHGGEVARALRAIDPRKPIIILSAYLSLPEDVTSNADLCLVKGLPPNELVTAIHRVLRAGVGEEPI
jgi:CheY-like chemotaxis protein